MGETEKHVTRLHFTVHISALAIKVKYTELLFNAYFSTLIFRYEIQYSPISLENFRVKNDALANNRFDFQRLPQSFIRVLGFVWLYRFSPSRYLKSGHLTFEEKNDLVHRFVIVRRLLHRDLEKRLQQTYN